MSFENFTFIKLVLLSSLVVCDTFSMSSNNQRTFFVFNFPPALTENVTKQIQVNVASTKKGNIDVKLKCERFCPNNESKIIWESVLKGGQRKAYNFMINLKNEIKLFQPEKMFNQSVYTLNSSNSVFVFILQIIHFKVFDVLLVHPVEAAGTEFLVIYPNSSNYFFQLISYYDQTFVEVNTLEQQDSQTKHSTIHKFDNCLFDKSFCEKKIYTLGESNISRLIDTTTVNLLSYQTLAIVLEGCCNYKGSHIISNKPINVVAGLYNSKISGLGKTNLIRLNYVQNLEELGKSVIVPWIRAEKTILKVATATASNVLNIANCNSPFSMIKLDTIGDWMKLELFNASIAILSTKKIFVEYLVKHITLPEISVSEHSGSCFSSVLPTRLWVNSYVWLGLSFHKQRFRQIASIVVNEHFFDRIMIDNKLINPFAVDSIGFSNIPKERFTVSHTFIKKAHKTNNKSLNVATLKDECQPFYLRILFVTENNLFCTSEARFSNTLVSINGTCNFNSVKDVFASGSRKLKRPKRSIFNDSDIFQISDNITDKVSNQSFNQYNNISTVEGFNNSDIDVPEISYYCEMENCDNCFNNTCRQCIPGYEPIENGKICSECENDTWGINCSQTCDTKCDGCDSVNGNCLFCKNISYQGDACDILCTLKNCISCFDDNKCSKCDIGFKTIKQGFCVACGYGWWGEECTESCRKNCYKCKGRTGSCISCRNDRTGLFCHDYCRVKNCDICSLVGDCLRCKTHHTLDVVTQTCCKHVQSTEVCAKNCTKNCISCNRLSGECRQCKDGYTGLLCEYKCKGCAICDIRTQECPKYNVEAAEINRAKSFFFEPPQPYFTISEQLLISSLGIVASIFGAISSILYFRARKKLNDTERQNDNDITSIEIYQFVETDTYK